MLVSLNCVCYTHVCCYDESVGVIIIITTSGANWETEDKNIDMHHNSARLATEICLTIIIS